MNAKKAASLLRMELIMRAGCRTDNKPITWLTEACMILETAESEFDDYPAIKASLYDEIGAMINKHEPLSSYMSLIAETFHNAANKLQYDADMLEAATKRPAT